MHDVRANYAPQVLVAWSLAGTSITEELTMDAERFDQLVKTMSRGATRRAMVGGLLGTTLSHLAGWYEAGAKSKKQRKQQAKKRQRARVEKRKPCTPGGPCTKQPDCCTTERCIDSVCVAGPGTAHASCVATGCPLSTNPCQELLCDQQSGACLPHNLPDTTPCNDNNACTTNDQCVAGQCVGTPIVCNDNNPCTIDSCDPATGCTVTNAPDSTTSCGSNQVCCQGVCCAEGKTCGDTGCQDGGGGTNTCLNGQPCATGCPACACGTFDCCPEPTPEQIAQGADRWCETRQDGRLYCCVYVPPPDARIFCDPVSPCDP